MELKDYLIIWELTSVNSCIPISYDRLFNEIQKLAPKEQKPWQIIAELEDNDLIELTLNGARTLTEKGLEIRKSLSSSLLPENNNNQDKGGSWEKFRNLCKYYIDCVHLSEKVQEYLYLEDNNIKFFLPSLDIDWLYSSHKIDIQHSQKQSVIINRIKTRKDEDEDVYIGYPLSYFTCSNKAKAYSPIFLIPLIITYEGNHIYAEIRHDEIEINRNWLEFNIPKNEHNQYLSAISYNEGPQTGKINIRVALQYIANRHSIELDINNLDYRINNEDSVQNKAALFIGNGLKYSKTLKKELNRISNESDETLNNTALAYVFREPVKPNNRLASQKFIALPFIASNQEQINAIEEALNTPATKVIGPPGTGKSQVAVNIIANMVYNNKSVLFTSKNHKAIHAIKDKGLAASPLFPLIQFCTNPDSSNTSVEWFKTDIDQLFGDCEKIKTDLNLALHRFTQIIEDAIDVIKDLQPYIDSRNNHKKKISTIQTELESIQSFIIESNDIIDKIDTEKVKKIINDLNEPKNPNSLLSKLMEIIFNKKKKREIAEQELRTLFPNTSQLCISRQTLKKRIERLIKYYIRIQELKNELTNEINEISQLGDYQNYLSTRQKVQKIISDNLKNALIQSCIDRIDKLKNQELDIPQLRNASKRLARQNLPFMSQIFGKEAQDEAASLFVGFTKLFPAWATTLLSLTKASPCIAGLFDRVIIDEAAQCEIPPIIPALFRAKGVTVIGDPEQFPPVITMRPNLHSYLFYIKHNLRNLENEKYDFTKNTAYSIIEQQPIMLREHFRCHEDIAEYFNQEYYHGNLKVMTDSSSLSFPTNLGYKKGIEWIDISNSLEEEKAKVQEILENLANANYQGQIGVICPFRKYADDLRTLLHSYSTRLPGFTDDSVNTVNGFQGGEKDVIIFMLGITDKLTKGEKWYVEAPENKYIYNVAVSRAKICFIIVGDRKKAQESSASPLRKLAKPPRPQKVLFQSKIEKMMYDALTKEGIKPEPQYPLAGRYLDLALPDYKLDIELDGVAYHTNNAGERNSDDTFRDMIIQSNGWSVIRFWSFDITNNIDECVKKIKSWIALSS